MKKLCIVALIAASFFNSYCQTLFVPSGTSGIGSSSSIYNVGIGTNAPAQTLHISPAAGSAYIRIDKPSSTSEGGLQFNTGNTARFYLWSDNIDNDALKIEGVGLPGEDDSHPRMMFPSDNKNVYMALSGGNVGIGTTTMGSYRLAVAGKIAATGEVRVFANGTTNFPDYVFDPGYKLPSLNETEKYVKENHHLPEVPSAKEIEKEGMSLNEMNMILLKKVEELTLHLIEMKKENVALKLRVEKLEE